MGFVGCHDAVADLFYQGLYLTHANQVIADLVEFVDKLH